VRKITCLPVLPVFAAALILFGSVQSLAQNYRRHVISATAGAINAITGQATVHAKGESEWQQLMITDDLNSGDRVRTASDGRVEMLLNPGSFLRVGGNSEVELSNNALENVEVQLVKGTAIVEATGLDDVELNINISTPHTKIAIVRPGLYRVSVVPGDTTELIVRKGRVILGDSQTKVKDGNKVIFSQANVSVAKMTKEEKKQEADVEAWSRERAETVARANRRTTDAMLASAFSRDSFSDWRLGRGFGLWFYNNRVGCYTFLPWYYGWRSPYGSHYTTGTYNPYAGRGYYGGGGNRAERAARILRQPDPIAVVVRLRPRAAHVQFLRRVAVTAAETAAATRFQSIDRGLTQIPVVQCRRRADRLTSFGAVP
jgi:hypothetical protein